MKSITILFIQLFFYSLLLSQDSSFLSYQLSQERVAAAYQDKYEIVKSEFESKGISFPSTKIYWRAFKWNKSLELWAFSEDSMKYILVKNYPICEVVGDLGPKRQEGDFQIPEGFYYFTHFNPISKYHLSLKVNYPNESDALLGRRDALGGEIYVHGNCETIGCIPMTDDLIKEIYIINLLSRAWGQEDIPIHIFPTRLTLKNLNKLKQEYFKENIELTNFWRNLKEVYDYFEYKRDLPSISVDLLTGKYIVR